MCLSPSLGVRRRARLRGVPEYESEAYESESESTSQVKQNFESLSLPEGGYTLPGPPLPKSLPDPSNYPEVPVSRGKWEKAVCVESLFLRSPGQAPYGAKPVCAKRAAYPDPP